MRKFRPAGTGVRLVKSRFHCMFRAKPVRVTMGRQQRSNNLCFVLLLLFFGARFICAAVFSEDDFYQVKACCSFTGPNFDKIEYILTSSFNKQKMMEYNSTRGNWIGFTDFSIVASHYWNLDPLDRLERAMEIKLMCYENIKYIQTIGNLSTTPTMRIKSVKQPDGRHPAMLVCSAYNFYPKQIQITWLRNDQEVTEGVSNTDVIPDGELYYQFHSYLEYTPTSGERISCMVEHVTLWEPRIIVWNNSLPEGEKTKIVVGLCGLIFGLVIFLSGFIYYKKKCAVYNSVYYSEEM
ncbi:HLA class II histocompatibility antigen, DQ beta 1 chain-like isoform X1 [Xiphophorus hellerii]|uniref:HLA class II histocompatibility antigen, DQ beta 1 chain-like isoform X1 n=1 Tax=Xiphophorus hellerii TaxID=8084 RepID=UPI0013B4487F|nr:HLA class II histocompatibility antigen, DQ beta 1 chain-like isoform X1 [Xiphophorus hellerii]